MNSEEQKNHKKTTDELRNNLTAITGVLEIITGQMVEANAAIVKLTIAVNEHTAAIAQLKREFDAASGSLYNVINKLLNAWWFKRVWWIIRGRITEVDKENV